MHSTQELLPACTSGFTALPAGGVQGGKGTGSQKVSLKFHAVLKLHTELTLVSALHPSSWTSHTSLPEPS